jgi:3-deoxy-D-manno-octulosonate 8-phosphate phosphatase (KDO 8-P phosphatase)
VIDAAIARRIRLVGLDVDGVLTDGGIYLGASDGAPVELKRYHIQDGLGIKFLRDAGLIVAIVTGRVSDSVRLRAEELGITEVVQDPHARKLPAFLSILERNGVPPEEAAFIGDDYPDLAIMRVVGMPVAVDNAVPDVKDAAQVRLKRGGGDGAVREFTELLLRARGEWRSVVERYVAERAGASEIAR